MDGFKYKIGDVLVHRAYLEEIRLNHWRALDHAPRLYVVGLCATVWADRSIVRQYYVRPNNVYGNNPATEEGLVRLGESEVVPLAEALAATKEPAGG